jgi:hypothetical protein
MIIKVVGLAHFPQFFNRRKADFLGSGDAQQPVSIKRRNKFSAIIQQLERIPVPGFPGL